MQSLMILHHYLRFILTGGFALMSLSLAAQNAAPIDSVFAAIEQGKVSLNSRLRYEHVDQSNFADPAHAVTVRARLGYRTAPWQGFQAMLEAEHVSAVIEKYADSLGSNPSKPVVMDPEVTEINQFWLSYAHEATSIKVGRQAIVWDNARFLGDVGWRQDQQAFDAVLLQDKSVDKLTLSYAYLWEILRIQADERNWGSDSHLIHAAWAGMPGGTLSAYAHLLDMSAAAASTQTYGLSYAGSWLIDSWKLLYRAEYANQKDYADNPADYSADYLALELGAGFDWGTVSLGTESLGNGFRTPLATVHAFNGWSDFRLPVLGNPGGIVDTYLKVTAKLPLDVHLLFFFHRLEAESGGTDYGDEWDLQLTRKLSKNITLLAKTALFYGRDGMPDIKKFWLQLDYAF